MQWHSRIKRYFSTQSTLGRKEMEILATYVFLFIDKAIFYRVFSLKNDFFLNTKETRHLASFL